MLLGKGTIWPIVYENNPNDGYKDSHRFVYIGTLKYAHECDTKSTMKKF